MTGCTHGSMADETNKGLTKREYFAAMAMQGYISRGSDRMQDHAINDADALIAKLNSQEAK